VPLTWAIDLDGVVWLAGTGLPGSAEAVHQLRAAGERVAFLTNNSGPRLEGHRRALTAIGIECAPADLATSAQAAATLVAPGSRVAVVGEEGIFEALAERGAQVVAPADAPEAVVVGRTVKLDYDQLAAASNAVREGARFIATNTDATFPVGGEVLPGAGALVAFVATASGRGPEVAGKPHEPMAALVRKRFGQVDIMAGDRPDTDGLFAKRAGARFGLVLSGVTRRQDLPVEPEPDFVADDLQALVRRWLAEREQAGRGAGAGRGSEARPAVGT
jgi:glycerol 3-phosphatase-2